MNIKNLFLAAITVFSATTSIFSYPLYHTRASQPTDIPATINATQWKKIKSGAHSAFVGATTGFVTGWATIASGALLKGTAVSLQSGGAFAVLFAALLLQEYTWRTKFVEKIADEFHNEPEKDLMNDIARLASWACFLSPGMFLFIRQLK